MKIVEFSPKDHKLVKEIYKFQLRHYKDDKNFVPALKMELLGNKLLGAKGILKHDHPFHQHADVMYYIAQDDSGRTLGTIAACINRSHNDHNKEQTGFFGFFECIDDQSVADALLNSAKKYIKSKNMNIMRGPCNFSSNESLGLLINAYDELPFMQTPYNKPYYAKLIENNGLKKSMDLLAEMLFMSPEGKEPAEIERLAKLERVAEKIKQRYNITFENLNVKKPKKHLAIIQELYYEAWKNNWGFVPMSEAEFDITAENLKIAADPAMAKIAYVNGDPAAFIVTLPDINEVVSKNRGLPEILVLLKVVWWLFRKKFTRGRLCLFGIREKYRRMGVDGVLFLDSFKSARENKRKYTHCEISWLLEINTLIIKAGEHLGAKEYKRWRLYDVSL